MFEFTNKSEPTTPRHSTLHSNKSRSPGLLALTFSTCDLVLWLCGVYLPGPVRNKMFFQSFLMVAAEMHLAVFSRRTCPATTLAPIGETAGLATVIWDQVMPQAFLADSVSIAGLKLIQKTFFLKLNYISLHYFLYPDFLGISVWQMY